MSQRIRPFLILAALVPGALCGQQGASNREWRYYGADMGSTRYAPLDQIDAAT